MFNWYKKVVVENYANFSGRARRSEYWYFVLFNFLFAIAAYLIDVNLGLNFEKGSGGPFYLIYILATFIPGLAVAIRRLHDVDKSGWFLLIVFVPFIGGIWLLVLFFSEGTIGKNNYGPDSKSNIDEINEIGKE
ncbi:DUF805 domain-containing protein [Flavobacterium gelidilacus]|jgi:uncharacterized membrane protein YhaH (DUF805 family)|uniref:DUF805 domain-containing protein n=1 Tax=Flavobacterium gelidilacus TaxID=206041 RepID=UPI000418FE76|nr:DUF805 domain-containing protein [Flavobacterium gelidilacus]